MADGSTTLPEELPWDWVDRGWPERREHERKSVILPAKIDTADGTLDCLTMDISAGGARLHIVETFDASHPVTLVLDGFGRFDARVAWRATAEIGLQFTDAPGDVAARLASVL